MSSPRVWNKRDRCTPTDAVYVGRPTKWGNPYAIGSYVQGLQGRVRVDRETAIFLYHQWLVRHPEYLAAAKHELRGKDLVCWCAPLACHADVLLEVANG